ncbi:MAG: type II toxin-antitoxin system RelE/ParE family toxin [Anaerolineales bacterium]|nr:type II toxin-antitoxin system RelE/ParE family toxin [Anaerolineales bacterium]
MSSIKKLPASFYQTATGNEPVRDWLLGLDADDRRTIGIDIATAEFGWPVGMPVCRALKNGLWEIRSNIRDGQIARVIFTVMDERMILLHGFVKKAQKIPKADLELALKRKKELGS